MQATAALRAAVLQADQVFEPRISRPAILCMHCDDAGSPSPERERFDAIMLAYRSRRLTLPVEAVAELDLGHGSAMVHQSLRRFAWFVPPLLAATLEPGNFVAGLRRFADLAAEARRDGTPFTTGEVECLAQFFEAAMDAIIGGTPEAGGELEALLRACDACAVNSGGLVVQWLTACGQDPGGPAEQKLLATIDATLSTGYIVRSLGRERVRTFLEGRVLAESDVTLARALSSAESVVSGWISTGGGDAQDPVSR